MNEILTIRNLNVTYKTKQNDVFAVKDVNLDFYEGDSIGIVGESGSGKSTLAMAILQLNQSNSVEATGEVIYNDENLLQLSTKELTKYRWKDIAVVFQKSMNALSPVHRIGAQIEDIIKVHQPKLTKEQLYNKIVEVLKLVNLSERVYKLYPHELSGGMLQRVAIAISVVHNPKILIMDEATTALDVVTQGQILDEIKKMEKNLKLTRIMITHDISVVASSCSKIVVMYAGEVMEYGYVKDVLKNPKHPYTKGLLTSFPSLKGKKLKLKGIPGSLPDLRVKVEGCIFADRCEHALPICKIDKPSATTTDHNNQVWCHLYSEGSVEI